ncbi:MAG TPA: LURP-one-related family protein [Ktedonobacterales bacterium]|jgi:uncharacterized protein YxjI|nr:LURP-one-related family protein [Ktedonobacterales bacterium]
MRYVVREKVFHLGEDSDITNESGNAVFHVDGKVFTMHDRLIVRDISGNEVANIQRRLIALRPTYEIERNGQEAAVVRKQLLHLFGDRFTVDIPGPDDLEIQGNIFEHDYTIKRRGETIATVSKRWISLTDTFGVDIAPGQDDVLILCCVLVLDLVEDKDHG